jgi:ElaA protein
MNAMKISWQWQAFHDLSPTALYKLLQLRASVFVVEQQCAYQDLDDGDYRALHLLGWTPDQQLAAYARLFFPAEGQSDCSIGRFVVASPYRRGSGLGIAMGREILKYFAASPHRNCRIVVSAQQYLEKLYERFGFRSQGEPYLEDGIWHVKMIKGG